MNAVTFHWMLSLLTLAYQFDAVYTQSAGPVSDLVSVELDYALYISHLGRYAFHIFFSAQQTNGWTNPPAQRQYGHSPISS